MQAWLAFSIALAAVAPGGAPLAAALAAPAAPSWYDVTFHEGPGLRPGDRLHGADVLAVLLEQRTVLVRSMDPPAFEAAARADPRVALVEPDAPWAFQPLLVPNDPLLGRQWAADALDLRAAWDVSLGSAAVKVAVLDTGIDARHEDLDGAVVNAHTFDPVAVPGVAPDDCQHGTHVAGIVAARTGNGIGVAGSAQVSLLAGKVLSCAGGFASSVAAGINWAVAQGAHVISMSLGSPSNSSVVRNAINAAEAAGVLVVAAAGNGGPCLDCVSFPARLPNVLAVASSSSTGHSSGFSSAGPEVDIAAPGAGILSTVPGNQYEYLSGTSMATPYVSGVAGLLWSQNLGWGAADIRAQLLATAASSPQDAAHVGAGLLDACAALGGPSCAPNPTLGGPRTVVEAYTGGASFVYVGCGHDFAPPKNVGGTCTLFFPGDTRLSIAIDDDVSPRVGAYYELYDERDAYLDGDFLCGSSGPILLPPGAYVVAVWLLEPAVGTVACRLGTGPPTAGTVSFGIA